MTEQQQVPPGIVRYKDLRSGEITHEKSWIGTWGGRKPSYEAVYRHLMLNGKNTHTVHTISVDGMEYSIDDKVYVFNIETIIKRFTWMPESKTWWVNTHASGTPVNSISKLPPSSLDRSGSQPGKPFIHSGGEMNKSYYDKQPQPSLTEDESVIEYADRMRSEHNPVQPGEGKEEASLQTEIYDILQDYLDKNNRETIPSKVFFDLSKQIAALKSTDGWRDAFEAGRRSEIDPVYSPTFNQWLSSYKAKTT